MYVCKKELNHLYKNITLKKEVTFSDNLSESCLQFLSALHTILGTLF